jgi:hypothetical protein
MEEATRSTVDLLVHDKVWDHRTCTRERDERGNEKASEDHICSFEGGRASTKLWMGQFMDQNLYGIWGCMRLEVIAQGSR